jgi:hypothetical protein
MCRLVPFLFFSTQKLTLDEKENVRVGTLVTFQYFFSSIFFSPSLPSPTLGTHTVQCEIWFLRSTGGSCSGPLLTCGNENTLPFAQASLRRVCALVTPRTPPPDRVFTARRYNHLPCLLPPTWPNHPRFTHAHAPQHNSSTIIRFTSHPLRLGAPHDRGR